jgi:hypothetical protein
MMLLPGNQGLCAVPQARAGNSFGTQVWRHQCFDPAGQVASAVGNRSEDALFQAAQAMRLEELMSNTSCTEMAAVLPTCGGAPRHWLPLLAAMVAAGGAAAAITLVGWGRVVSRSSHGHRYWQAGTTDAPTARAAELEAGAAGAGEVELGSWRLQSTSLRLRRQDFEFLRSADGQLVMLGQGGTAKASRACVQCVLPMPYALCRPCCHGSYYSNMLPT